MDIFLIQKMVEKSEKNPKNTKMLIEKRNALTGGYFGVLWHFFVRPHIPKKGSKKVKHDVFSCFFQDPFFSGFCGKVRIMP